MHPIASWLFLGLVIAGGATTFALWPQKPTRAECTAAYELDWTGVADPRGARNAIAAAEAEKFQDRNRPAALSGWAFSFDRKTLLIFFHKDCDQKWQISDRMIASWKEKDIDAPVFTRVYDVGDNLLKRYGVDFRSRAWRDTPVY